MSLQVACFGAYMVSSEDYGPFLGILNIGGHLLIAAKGPYFREVIAKKFGGT